MKNITKLLQNFYKRDKDSRAWVELGPIRVYLRVSYRCINGRPGYYIDIANIEPTPMKEWNMEAAQCIHELFNVAPKCGIPIFVENVINPSIRGLLTRHQSYKPHPTLATCFFKL